VEAWTQPELADCAWYGAACWCEAGMGFLGACAVSEHFCVYVSGERVALCRIFAVEADREGDVLAMQKQMGGTGVTVRYDPENPDISILEDRQISGRRLTQNPHWLP
jgi:hypothetical protein